MSPTSGMRRPPGVAALSGFFVAGAAIAGISWLWLVTRSRWLEPMWKVNPRARDAIAGMGPGGVLILAAVSIACAFAAFGLWRGRVWGHRIAIMLIAANLAGGLAVAVSARDPRALAGLPVAAAVLLYLTSGGVRRFFRAAPRPA